MTNRPKAIGTAFETDVVRYARANGFPLAERRALAGNLDKGDLLLAPGIIAECKAVKTYSDNDVRLWLLETRREELNANATHSSLFVKRAGKSIGNCWAVHPHPETGVPVFMLLADCLTLYRMHGWGDEL